MSHTGRDGRLAFSFRSQPSMLPGPVAFDGFMPNNFLKTDSSVTSYVLPWTGWLSLAVRGMNVHIGAREVGVIVLAISTSCGDALSEPQSNVRMKLSQRSWSQGWSTYQLLDFPPPQSRLTLL